MSAWNWVAHTCSPKRRNWTGQVGPVAEVLEDKGKVKFSVVVFGRDTLVEADYTDLEKI